jgi:hypothetical protein
MADAAAAAASAAALFDLDEEVASDIRGNPQKDSDVVDNSEEDDEDPLDLNAIEGLMEDFRNSLEQVFSYTALSAKVVQDKLSLNEPVDLLQTWDNDDALQLACNNLIRGKNNYAMDDIVPIFRFSLSHDLILYQEWVHL